MANENFVDSYLGVPQTSFRNLVKFGDSLTYVDTLMYSLNGDLENRFNLISTSKRVTDYIDSKSETFKDIVVKYWKDMLWTTSSASCENYTLQNYDYKNRRMLFRLNSDIYLDANNDLIFDFDTNKRITFDTLVYVSPVLKTNNTTTINTDPTFNCPMYWHFSHDSALSNLNKNFSKYSEKSLNLNFLSCNWASYYVELADGVKLNMSCTASDVNGDIRFGSTSDNIVLQNGENHITTSLSENVLAFINDATNNQLHSAKITDIKATVYDLIDEVYPNRTGTVYAHPYDEFVLPAQSTTLLSSIDVSTIMARSFQPGNRPWEIELECNPVNDGNTYSLVKTDTTYVILNEIRPLFEIRCVNNNLDFHAYGVSTDINYTRFYILQNLDKIKVKLALDSDTFKIYIKEKYDLHYKLVYFKQCSQIIDSTTNTLFNLREKLQEQSNLLIFNNNNKTNLISDVYIEIDKHLFADMSNITLDYGVSVNDWLVDEDYQIAAFTSDLSSHKIYTNYITSEEAPEETARTLWYDWNSKVYREYQNGNWVIVNYIPAVIRTVENNEVSISYSDWDSYKDNTVVAIKLNDIIPAGLYRLYFDNYNQQGKVVFEFGKNKIYLETTPQSKILNFQHDSRIGEKYIYIKPDEYAQIDCSILRVEPISEISDSTFNDIPAFTSSSSKFYQNNDEQITVAFNNLVNSDALTCLCQMTGDFDVSVDSIFNVTQGAPTTFEWDLTYGSQHKVISNYLTNYNCNSFVIPFSSESNVKDINLSINTANTPVTAGRINNVSFYKSMLRNGSFCKQTDWYEEGTGIIDTTACCARASGVYKLYQTFDTGTINTGDELFTYVNLSQLLANQHVKIYLKDQVSQHEVSLLNVTFQDAAVHNQFITKTVYDGVPIVTNPLYLGAYKLNVTLDNLIQDDFILFDLTSTVWVRQDKKWVDTGEVYDPIYGSNTYPTIITHVNENYIGAFEDPSELPETADVGNFAYVFASIYVYDSTEFGWINVGYIVAQEDNYPRYTETNNPHFRGNGVVKVLKLDDTEPDFTNVYTDQFMDLNLNDTEIKFNGTTWIDTGDRIGTTPHNVDSNYQLFVEFDGTGITANQPVLLNSLCIQKTNAKPVYTTENFKDIFSWNINAFENNHLVFTGNNTNTEIKLINYVLKPNTEYTIGFNYTNSYAVGRLRFKCMAQNSEYTSTEWLTIGSANAGNGKIANGIIKVITPASESCLVIEPDDYYKGIIDDLTVVVSNYLVVSDNNIAQNWQTISDSYIPVANNYWNIKFNTLQTNGYIPAYSTSNKNSAVICYLDSIAYGNNVNVNMIVDSLDGVIIVQSGDEQSYYTISSAGTYNFGINLGESASLMIVTSGIRTKATISKFEVLLNSGTVRLSQDGYLNDGTIQYTSATTFNVNGGSVGSDIKAQQNRKIELFQNDSDSTTAGTYIRGFYNSRTNQIEAIEWRQDGYVTDSTLVSYITSGTQTLNNTLLNQVFFDENKVLYVSTERVLEQNEQPELKNNQVWYNPINKKYFINILGTLTQVQYLGYCATDENKIVICHARPNRKKLTTPIKPYVEGSSSNIQVNNLSNQKIWKKFLTEQNSYWHNRLFNDATINVNSSGARLINVLTRSIPDNYGTTYQNWMDAGEIYYIGQNDNARNVYWDHELQCYRWKTNGDIVIAQIQQDSNNSLFYHNLYSDYTIIDRSMFMYRTAWKNENCTAQIYLIGGAGALTLDQTPVTSSSFTAINGLNAVALSGGICIGGTATGIYTNYNGLYQSGSGKDMPLNINIRFPNTGNEGWTALSTLPYGQSGTFVSEEILTSAESKCCRPSGGVVYMEEYLRRLIGVQMVVAAGTTSNINGKVNTGNGGAIIIIERWNS